MKFVIAHRPIHKAVIVSLARALIATSLLGAVTAHAAQTTFTYDHSFSGGMPSGSAPWITSVFDDFNTVGSVTLTMSAHGLSGNEFIGGLYFNLDTLINPGTLTFSSASGTSPAAAVNASTNAYRADGDGYYDILFDFPPPGRDRFNAGETVSYIITGAHLTAGSFYALSSPGPGSTAGPFLSAAHIQGIASGASAWVAPVPEASTSALFAAGLALLGFARRRAR